MDTPPVEGQAGNLTVEKVTRLDAPVMRKIVIETDGSMVNVSTNECSKLETIAILNLILDALLKG